eukprot:2718928-Rhodomonas_salina.3
MQSPPRRALATETPILAKLKAPLLAGAPLEFLEIRVGIHVGPTTCGVLGKVMPRFQVFGSAVNMAARMEQTSKPGMVHVSRAFHDLIGEQAPVAWHEPRVLRGVLCVWVSVALSVFLSHGLPDWRSVPASEAHRCLAVSLSLSLSLSSSRSPQPEPAFLARLCAGQSVIMIILVLFTLNRRFPAVDFRRASSCLRPVCNAGGPDRG